jgi:leucyl-tRNA synthetase
MKRYDPIEIEKKWQKYWEENDTYKVDFSDHSKPKYYAMSMLPGITGAGIHIGHGRTYQFSDIKVRAKRQQGYNAYHPIGWDSFGLPVENYAIKVGKKPREAHDEALVNFKRQLKRLGYSYDWSKEVSTADPNYYKWTQWIFNQLYAHGLAYQKESPQWWCETDQTVLANEQVEGGKCWRCGNQVTKKNLKQWFFKITEYADEMLEAIDDLDWTDMVKTMQRNWIGRSQGAEIEFKVDSKKQVITVFTTRPDTLFGATFMVLAPEHEMAKKLATDETRTAVEEYIQESARKSEIERMNESREKTGVFTGSYAVNPVNGEKIPIWLADYVLAGYGTGAIMAVPAHDERDQAFAIKFGIGIKEVILPHRIDINNPPLDGKDRVERQGVHAIVYNPKTDQYLCVQWKKFPWTAFVVGGVEDEDSGDVVAAAKREIYEETGYKNIKLIRVLGGQVVSEYYAAHKDLNRKAYVNAVLFELIDDQRDEPSEEEQSKQTPVWLKRSEITKDRMTCAELDIWLDRIDNENAVYTSEGILTNSGSFDGMSSSDAREEIVSWLEQQGVGKIKTTYKMRDWLISRQRYWGAPIPIIHCPEHGAVPVPDDQLPVVLPDVDEFKPSGGATSALANVTDWVNTTCPKCGKPAKRETDTMDGYACSSWYFLRYLDPFNDKQAWDPEIEKYWGPVDFYNGADHAVAHLLYSRFWTRFFHKLGLVDHPEPFKRMMYNAYILAPDGTKMSKSKGNTIDPLEIMDSGYGADSLRVYEMFIAPYDMEAPWDTRGVPGTYRFLNRVWHLVQEYIEAGEVKINDNASKEILVVAHRTTQKVTDDINNDKFNTAISAMMEAVNGYYKLKEKHGIGRSESWDYAIESLLQILSPFAPHITEELWHQIGHDDTIHIDHWPTWDSQYLKLDVITVVVQVNGKMRAKLEVAADASEDDIKQLAFANDNVKSYIDNKEPARIIYVPGRLMNIVVV